jgi:hypothetical protein
MSTWSFADVLFAHDELDLNADKAREYAAADVVALRITAEAGLYALPFYKEPHQTSSDHMLLVCQNLLSLIDSPSVDESNIQAFLEQKEHRFLLRPDAQEIHPRRRIGHGHYVPDFICQRTDGDYHLIEIEDPKQPIYQEKKGEQSAHLTHALTQVQDWLMYIDDNRDTVRREDKLEGIYRPTGEVIAGRDEHLNEIGRRRFDHSRAEFDKMRIRIRTYDMLLKDARVYATNLARFGGRVSD